MLILYVLNIKYHARQSDIDRLVVNQCCQLLDNTNEIIYKKKHHYLTFCK